MNTKAIAFDLDDTLLRDDLSISDFTIDTLRQAAASGIRIIPASGRAKDSMKRYVDQIGCASCFIACNGAEVWAPDHTLLMRKFLPQETALEIAAFGEAHGAYAQTYEGAYFYFTHQGKYADDYAAQSNLTGKCIGPLAPFLKEHESSKILMMDAPDRITRMLHEARERFGDQVSVTCSKPWFLEFNPIGATKGEALAWCGERFGFTVNDAMTFGDSLNDLSMLECAGLGVAMANAREDVKARVHTFCRSNNEDGVARFIHDSLMMQATMEVPS